ncbi:MAG: redoxin domain-containing protein [Steroidobacteraceae bacterium]|jgi:peroxiredoxin|nr:redoxin domain-containing protein [Steroidobacteraceae bacterium]
MHSTPFRPPFAALVCAVLLAAAGPALATPRIGAQAPDFTAVDSNGKSHRLADFRGRTVVLEWTNADCPYVKKHYAGNMQALQRLAKENGVMWLSVISSAPRKQGHVAPARANELTKSRNAEPAAVLLDEQGAVGRAYEAKTTPHMYVIDPQGVLRYMGGIDSLATAEVADVEKAQPFLREAMLAVAKDQPVANAVTRPYGCSVKY